MNGKYLSEIIDIDDLEQGKLNLIKAPCGSGKTIFAKTVLKDFTKEFSFDTMLYLIDTSTGKEQLLHSAEPQENLWTGDLYWKLDGITVMTYAGYATLHNVAPEHDRWAENSVIVCDELQEEIDWSRWAKDENHKLAIDLVATRINIGGNVVVAISATPSKIREEFEYCIHEVPLHGEPLHYEDAQTDEYYNLQPVLNKIQPNQKGIIYTPLVRDIIKYNQLLVDRGIKSAGIWSINNADHPMTKEQKKIRDYIIDYQKIPDYIDVLFINKACQTSININGKVDFMIVHSPNSDTQVQARGRYRNDLEQLYLYATDAEDDIVLDERWLNNPLYKADKDALCEYLGLKDERGRVLGWTSVKKALIDAGYEIQEKKSGATRFTIIN